MIPSSIFQGWAPHLLRGRLHSCWSVRLFCRRKVVTLLARSRRIVKAINEYVFSVENLRNGLLENIHVTRLKYYHDFFLHTETIIVQVVAHETGMPVHRLMRIVDTKERLMIQVRWRRGPDSEDTLKTTKKLYQDVPQLFCKLLDLQNTLFFLVNRARRELRP